ncbi:Transposon Ty3-I Gag-Pol polyprotein [Araneus ventricosus]|uniref:Transposon Ty3-I Gag-Pol polyprotein n=1 Tax=Araneus ventricosus TaxID=182803 RepID=A0A4Y2JHZ0_ARAVE|nr:Transposon Ty3-I Gag-Pol polyprotein [Araneus ventricosus]
MKSLPVEKYKRQALKPRRVSWILICKQAELYFCNPAYWTAFTYTHKTNFVTFGVRSGIIEESSGPWASPIVLVKKKDGSTRFCVDYRKLNEITKKDSYRLPRIDDTLDALNGSQWFTTLDLKSGYWQIEIRPEDREKTAFTTG